MNYIKKLLVFLALICSAYQINKEEAKEMISELDRINFQKDFNFTAGERNEMVFNLLDLVNNDLVIEMYAEKVGLPKDDELLFRYSEVFEKDYVSTPSKFNVSSNQIVFNEKYLFSTQDDSSNKLKIIHMAIDYYLDVKPKT